MKSMYHLRREHRHLQHQHHHNLGLIAVDAQAKKAKGPSRARHLSDDYAAADDDDDDAIVDDTATRAHPRRVRSTDGCYLNSDLASFNNDWIDCIRDPNHPNRNIPTVSPTAAPTVSDPELPPGAIVGLIIFGVFVFGLLAVCNLAYPTPPPTSSNPPIRPRPAGGNVGRWQTTSTQNAEHGHPFNRPTTTPTRPATVHNSTQEQPLSPHQQAVNLVKSMTRSERRVYVANFLHTQKYVEPDDTETTAETADSAAGNSARFVVSQSTRILNPKASEPSTAAPSCAICLDEFEDGEDVCSSQNAHCPHQFHLTCAFEWLLSSQECPCCRRDYLTIGQVLSSRRLVTPAVAPPAPTTSSTDGAPSPVDMPPSAPAEMTPTAPMEAELPAESELPVESDVDIRLPVAESTLNDASLSSPVRSEGENALFSS